MQDSYNILQSKKYLNYHHIKNNDIVFYDNTYYQISIYDKYIKLEYKFNIYRINYEYYDNIKKIEKIYQFKVNDYVFVNDNYKELLKKNLSPTEYNDMSYKFDKKFKIISIANLRNNLYPIKLDYNNNYNLACSYQHIISINDPLILYKKKEVISESILKFSEFKNNNLK